VCVCHCVYLRVSLCLGLYEAGQYLCGQRQVSEEDLSLLVETQQGEVVPQLHGDDCVLLLQREREKGRER